MTRDAGDIDDLISIVGQYGEAGRIFMVAIMSDWGDRDIGPRDVLAKLRPDFAAIPEASVRSFAPSGLDAGSGSGLEVIVTAPSFEEVAAFSDEMTGRLRDNSDLLGVRRDYEISTPAHGRAARLVTPQPDELTGNTRAKPTPTAASRRIASA